MQTCSQTLNKNWEILQTSKKWNVGARQGKAITRKLK